MHRVIVILDLGERYECWYANGRRRLGDNWSSTSFPTRVTAEFLAGALFRRIENESLPGWIFTLDEIVCVQPSGKWYRFGGYD